MSKYNDEHIAGCGVCATAVSETPRPFDEDLCHMDIRPDNDYAEYPPPVQCPHLKVPRHWLCTHHLEGALASYARLVERTAPYN